MADMMIGSIRMSAHEGFGLILNGLYGGVLVSDAWLGLFLLVGDIFLRLWPSVVQGLEVERH